MKTTKTVSISASTMLAMIVSIGLTTSSMIMADEAKLDQPQDLAAQVIDNSANQEGSTAKQEEMAEAAKTDTQSGDDEAKAVPHFAGHAFAE